MGSTFLFVIFICNCAFMINYVNNVRPSWHVTFPFSTSSHWFKRRCHSRGPPTHVITSAHVMTSSHSFVSCFLFHPSYCSLKNGIMFTLLNNPLLLKTKISGGGACEEGAGVRAHRPPCCSSSCQTMFFITSSHIWTTNLSVASLKFVKVLISSWTGMLSGGSLLKIF